MTQFWQNGMHEIRFLYGLVFFVLGLAIVLQPRRGSVYYLATALSWLAAFALIHAAGDWMTLTISFHQNGILGLQVKEIVAIRVAILTVSFGFLMHFGLSLLLQKSPWRSLAWILSTAVSLFFLGMLVKEYPSGGPSPWFLTTRVFSRYFLGFPAGILTALGLLTQVGTLKQDKLGKHVGHLYGAAACFALYAVVGGLIPPRAGFFPASVLNEEFFFQTLGVPVEVFRALAMAGVAFFMLRLLGIFHLETQRRLHVAEQDRALLRERERIARELHDGIMQTLYGTGLGLKQMMNLCQAQPQQGPILAELDREIGRAIVQMRRFVLDLKEVSVPAAELLDAIRSQARDVSQFAGIHIAVNLDAPLPAEVQVPAGVREEVLAIVREGLSNIVRHAQTDAAFILFSLEDDTVLLRITDAGQGFDQTHSGPGRALEAARDRVEAMGGLLQVMSSPGMGTQLVAHIPLTPRRHGGARPKEAAQ